MLSYIINSNAATIVTDNRTFTVRKDHTNWDAILTALNEGDEARVVQLVDIPDTLKRVSNGRITVSDEGVFFNGEPLHTGLASRILTLIREGYQGLATPLTNFLDNLMNNPSRRAVQGLYEWLEKSNLPITDDGCIIAWKIVGPNFMDLYSGKFDNSPGKVVEVQRNEVDEDPDRTCSHGLHICSNEYLPKYGTREGNKVVMVKVNPADVVAFPRDYNTSKGRVCKYEVLREVTREAAPSMFNDKQVVDAKATVDFKPTGLYVQDGKLVLFDDDNKEVSTGLLEQGDYTFEDIDGGVRFLPSKRIVRF